MLRVDLSSLGTHAALVSGELQSTDPVWSADDVSPDGAVQVEGRLSAAGSGKYYFAGRLKGSAVSSCRRCLEPASLAVDEEIHVLFAEAGNRELEESDVYLIEARAHEIDLRPAVREEWLLAVPSFALCREDCLGLCPACGSNRNMVPCTCSKPSDPRWDALRAQWNETSQDHIRKA